MMRKVIVLALALALCLSCAMAEGREIGLPEGVEWGVSLDAVRAVLGQDCELVERGDMSMLSSYGETVEGYGCDFICLFYRDALVAVDFVFHEDASMETVVEMAGPFLGASQDFDLYRVNQMLSTLDPALSVDAAEMAGSLAFEGRDSGVYIVVMNGESGPELVAFAEDMIRGANAIAADWTLAAPRPNPASEEAAMEAEPETEEAEQAVEETEPEREEAGPEYAAEPEEAAEPNATVFSVSIKFDVDSMTSAGVDRAEEALARINDVLYGMELSRVSIEDKVAYLSRDVYYNDAGGEDRVEYKYGFDELTLLCERAEGEDLFRFQMDTVVDVDGTYTSEEFHDEWSAQNPNQVMRQLLRISGDNFDDISIGSVFIVLYHERG